MIMGLGGSIYRSEPFESVEECNAYFNHSHITCLLCGKQFRQLHRHIQTHGFTLDEYRKRYNIPAKHSLISGELRKIKSEIGKKVDSFNSPANIAKMKQIMFANHLKDQSFVDRNTTPLDELAQIYTKRLCKKYNISPQEVDDIAQEALLTILSKTGQKTGVAIRLYQIIHSRIQQMLEPPAITFVPLENTEQHDFYNYNLEEVAIESFRYNQRHIFAILLSVLTKNESDILFSYHWRGENYKDIAQQKQLSCARIQQIAERAYRRLRHPQYKPLLCHGTVRVVVILKYKEKKEPQTKPIKPLPLLAFRKQAELLARNKLLQFQGEQFRSWKKAWKKEHFQEKLKINFTIPLTPAEKAKLTKLKNEEKRIAEKARLEERERVRQQEKDDVRAAISILRNRELARTEMTPQDQEQYDRWCRMRPLFIRDTPMQTLNRVIAMRRLIEMERRK